MLTGVVVPHGRREPLSLRVVFPKGREGATLPPKKKSAAAVRTSDAKRAKAEAGSVAAETARLDAKADRVRAVMSEGRRREAELTKQGYCF
jgi:hypothetical protein